MENPLTDEQLIQAARGLLMVSCKNLHEGPCLKYWINNFIHGLVFSLKFYGPLYIGSSVLRYQIFFKDPVKVIKFIIKSTLRSAMVLAVMVLIAKITICIYLKTIHKGDSLIMLLISLAITPSALIENPAKVSELAVYVMPRFFDAFWKFLKRRKLNLTLPYFQVIIFSLSLSLITYSTFCEKKLLRPMLLKISQNFFGLN
jgi:hypothetical protein